MIVNAYIDGFNLYHAIDELNKKKLHGNANKWLDLHKLCETFLSQGDTLNKVYYFSALPTHLNNDKLSRHSLYVKALQSVNVTAILGKFKRKDSICKLCHRKYEAYEEKQSDINIAITMLKDAFSNDFDKAFLVTADTDLVSAVKMLKGLGKRIILLTPPNRDKRANELKQNADASFEIRQARLMASLLPNTIQYGGQTIVKPIQYS